MTPGSAPAGLTVTPGGPVIQVQVHCRGNAAAAGTARVRRGPGRVPAAPGPASDGNLRVEFKFTLPGSATGSTPSVNRDSDSDPGEPAA